ncbi:hypothetical protein VFPPC_02085 [Pochonia chlamydosporia 170]|uniref:Uncharacterized protein n=1 Tax=Pochonia chlamydosporia 170 TaxID=1380566 RepID=A0A179F6M9_METCM|nr:hypothetical protein VFPPC_02085 [Pochonia chlamydosporia 170]OAQ61062.1 hypothetical protein VFPPC_02085 [Pochonia chlamydosporia 170]
MHDVCSSYFLKSGHVEREDRMNRVDWAVGQSCPPDKVSSPDDLVQEYSVVYRSVEYGPGRCFMIYSLGVEGRGLNT